MREVKKKVFLPVLLIVVFALSRWPGLMPSNFSAAYAIVFCAGLYLPGSIGWVFPLALLAVSDLLLNKFFYTHSDFSLGKFLVDELPVVLTYGGLVALGRAFQGKRPLWMLIGGGILGAILFYIVTNTAAWLTLPGYAKTFAGWLQAITIGLPGYPQTWEFFRNTLLSGGLFTGLFAGAMKLTGESAEEKKEPAEAPEAEPAEPSEAEV